MDPAPKTSEALLLTYSFPKRLIDLRISLMTSNFHLIVKALVESGSMIKESNVIFRSDRWFRLTLAVIRQ